MLDSKFVLENLESVRQRLGTRGRAFDLGPLVALSAEWKEVLRKVEDLRSERNRVSEDIPRMKKEGKDAAPVILAMRKVGEEITRLEAVLNEVEERLNDFLLNIPWTEELSRIAQKGYEKGATSYLEVLEAAGQLVRIRRQVDLHHELAAVAATLDARGVHADSLVRAGHHVAHVDLLPAR